MICCNEFGQIIDFAFTKTPGSHEVKPLIQKIKQQCPDVGMLASDNCCSDRRNLQDGWGSQIRVVLDTFHALQVQYSKNLGIIQYSAYYNHNCPNFASN